MANGFDNIFIIIEKGNLVKILLKTRVSKYLVKTINLLNNFVKFSNGNVLMEPMYTSSKKEYSAAREKSSKFLQLIQRL